MQKLLRILVLLLLLVVIGGIVYTQTQLYTTQQTASGAAQPAGEKPESKAQAAVAQLAAKRQAMPPSLLPVGDPGRSASAGQPPAPAPAASVGTRDTPLMVKIVEQPEAADAAEEHARNREVLQAIAHNTSRIAAAGLAQNFLLLFQAVIYFLTLVILFMLLENVKKFADAAAKSAEAARKSAEMAEAAAKQSAKPAGCKFPPQPYRRR